MTMLCPDSITPQVSAFLDQIAPGQPFYWVKIRNQPGVQPGECFFNCRSHNRETGSATVLGWAIWEMKGKMLEAEHHAICRDGDERFCITPQLDGADRVLFLEDPMATYDYNDRRSAKTSQFMNTSSFRLVDDLIAARLRFIHYMKLCTDAAGVVNADADVFDQLRGDVSNLLKRISRK